jgi:hypothetical protein
MADLFSAHRQFDVCVGDGDAFEIDSPNNSAAGEWIAFDGCGLRYSGVAQDAGFVESAAEIWPVGMLAIA